MSEYDSVSTPDDVLKLAQERTGLTEIDWDELATGTRDTPRRTERLADSHAARPGEPDQPVHHCGWQPAEGARLCGQASGGARREDPAPAGDARDAAHRHHRDQLPARPRPRAAVPAALGMRASSATGHHQDACAPIRDVWRCSRSSSSSSSSSRKRRCRCRTGRTRTAQPRTCSSTTKTSRRCRGTRSPRRPRYAEWLIDEADMTSTYEYMKRFLQVSAVESPRRVEPQDAVALGAHRGATESVPGCSHGVGASRPVQGDRLPVQHVDAAAEDGDKRSGRRPERLGPQGDDADESTRRTAASGP